MNKEQAINELKEICQEIGCSGLGTDMCQNMPHLCSIIRKLIYTFNMRIEVKP